MRSQTRERLRGKGQARVQSRLFPQASGLQFRRAAMRIRNARAPADSILYSGLKRSRSLVAWLYRARSDGRGGLDLFSQLFGGEAKRKLFPIFSLMTLGA